MFEKTKQKAKKCKEWAIRNKAELSYLAGCVVGTVLTTAIFMYDDKKVIANTKKKYPHETNILSLRKNADYYDVLYNSAGETTDVTLEGLSDRLIANGGIPDSKVIGALVYTKK